MHWSSFYDNIFEHPERPESKVIENDELLDKWVKDKTKEMEEIARKNRKNKGSGTSMSAYDHDDVIIFDEEEWEEIIEEEEDYEESEEY